MIDLTHVVHVVIVVYCGLWSPGGVDGGVGVVLQGDHNMQTHPANPNSVFPFRVVRSKLSLSQSPQCQPTPLNWEQVFLDRSDLQTSYKKT